MAKSGCWYLGELSTSNVKQLSEGGSYHPLAAGSLLEYLQDAVRR